MKLFLLRHADALHSCPDESRALSPKGKKQIQALADAVNSEAFCNVAQIWHSPYCRAADTAKIFAHGAGLERAPLIENCAFTPDSDPEAAARSIVSVCGMGADLLVVAHNPLLEKLATLLVCGASRRRAFEFQTASLLCLRLDAEPLLGDFGRWTVTSFASPDFVCGGQGIF